MPLLRIYLEHAAGEALVALGRPWGWNFAVRQDDDKPPENHWFLGELDVTFPAPNVAAPAAAAYLDRRLADIRAQAEKECTDINERKQKLLALPCNEGEKL